MLHQKTKPDKKLLTAQEFLNVEDISDGILYSRDGYLFGYLSVRAGDNHLLSDEERIALAQNLTSAVSTGNNEPFQILSIPRTVDTMTTSYSGSCLASSFISVRNTSTVLETVLSWVIASCTITLDSVFFGSMIWPV